MSGPIQSLAASVSDRIAGRLPQHYVVWIDEVGAFALCLPAEVSLGGPASGAATADIPLLANLSQQHARIRRSGERYVLHALGPALVNGRPVVETCDLQDQSEIVLGANVRLRFRLPSAMSGSARLEFISDHRPQVPVEAVILMDQTCLLGPGSGQHIACPTWPESVLLFVRDGELWCKSRGALFVDDQQVDGQAVLRPGAVVRGHECCFRLEPLQRPGSGMAALNTANSRPAAGGST